MWDIYTQGVASLCPGLSACYPFRELTLQDDERIGASPPGEGYRCGSRGAYFLLPSAAILFSGGLEGPAWQDWELRHWAAAKTRLEQRPMTEGPRRYAS